MGLDQLYTGRAGGSSRGKGFNNIVYIWPGGNDIARRVEGPEFDFGQNLFLFASFLFFLFFFSFSLLFSYCSFALFCSYTPNCIKVVIEKSKKPNRN